MPAPLLITSDTDYQARLADLDALIDADPQPGSDAFSHMQLLGLVIADYESRTLPLPEEMDPVEAIAYALEQKGLTRKALEPLLGSASRVSEVMNRKRGLSKEMIRALHAALHIPLELLLRENTPLSTQVKPRTKTMVPKAQKTIHETCG